jgi:hypothetical protein
MSMPPPLESQMAGQMDDPEGGRRRSDRPYPMAVTAFETERSVTNFK